MATVLAFRGESHRYHEELERDTPPPDRLRNAIRENCGLFVVIQDSHVFLLHQTAREFLIQLPPELSDARSPSLKWQHSLNLKESHRLLSEIRIRYLLLADFKKKSMARRPQESDDKGNFVFLDYAASYWADHYRQAHNTRDMDLEHLALQLCNANSRTCSNWLKVYGKLRLQEPKFSRELPTLLLIASYFGLDNLVNHILQDNKTSLDIRGTLSKRTALSWASEKGHKSIVRSLLDRVPKHQLILKDRLSSSSPTIVNQTDKFGKSPLCYSATNGHRKIVRYLLNKGAKINTRDKNGLTPLSWAAYHGHNGIVALLLENGARQDFPSKTLERRDRRGRTPLQRAARHGNQVVAKLLLDSGAKVNALDYRGETALTLASTFGFDIVAKLLLDNGAQVDVSTKDGSTALMHASISGSSAIAKLLLESGAKIDALDKDGWTALMFASFEGHDTITKLLLDNGAQVNIVEKDGWTALMVASDEGYDAITKLLLDSGAQVNVSNKDGWTALMLASQGGHDATAKLLLDYGAQVDISEDGWTALMVASDHGHSTTAKLLLDHGAQIHFLSFLFAIGDPEWQLQ